jgi:hypothetical protein
MAYLVREWCRRFVKHDRRVRGTCRQRWADSHHRLQLIAHRLLSAPLIPRLWDYKPSTCLGAHTFWAQRAPAGIPREAESLCCEPWTGFVKLAPPVVETREMFDLSPEEGTRALAESRSVAEVTFRITHKSLEEFLRCEPELTFYAALFCIHRPAGWESCAGVLLMRSSVNFLRIVRQIGTILWVVMVSKHMA